MFGETLLVCLWTIVVNVSTHSFPLISENFPPFLLAMPEKMCHHLERQWDKSIIHYILHYRQFSRRTQLVWRTSHSNLSNDDSETRQNNYNSKYHTALIDKYHIQRFWYALCVISWIESIQSHELFAQSMAFKRKWIGIAVDFRFEICRQRLFTTKWNALIKGNFYLYFMIITQNWDLIWELWKKATKKAWNSQWATSSNRNNGKAISIKICELVQ